jgi:hypothetical protein
MGVGRREFIASSAAAFLANLSGIRQARAAPLQSFTIASLVPSCWCFGDFPSTAQHVAQNLNGTFYSVALSTNDPVSYTSTNFAIFRDTGSGPILWWQGTLGTNMLSLEAFQTGELHAIFANWISGTIVDMVFVNPAASNVPTIATNVVPGGASNVKIGTCADEQRRCLYVMGASGYWYRLNASGAVVASQQVVKTTGSSWPVYWSLSMDEDDRLFAAVSTSNSAGAASPNYDSVTAMMCVDPSDAAPTWTTGPWTYTPPSTGLTLPIDPSIEGPATWLTAGEQQRNDNNLLISSMVANGALHAAIAETPAAGERFFDADNLANCSVELTSASWAGVNSFQAANAHRPARGATIFPRCASGALLRRNWGLYFIGADNAGNIVALKNPDGLGQQWHDYASTPAPGYGSLGTLIMYVNATRGNPDDPMAAGGFNLLDCTPSQWGLGAASFQPPTSAFSFFLPLN